MSNPTSIPPANPEVLIAGAGPTGRVLALRLTKLGVRVRIFYATAELGRTSRALAVQARTLELYHQLDLAGTIVAQGHKVPAVNLWAEGQRKAHLDFTAVGADLTPYSFLEIFPQDLHERLLLERLKALGVTVERQTELMGFREEDGHVVAHLRGGLANEEERRTGLPISPAATARDRSSGRPSGRVSPGAPTSRSSTSPTSRPPARRSTANCTSISTPPTFSPSFPSRRHGTCA